MYSSANSKNSIKFNIQYRNNLSAFLEYYSDCPVQISNLCDCSLRGKQVIIATYCKDYYLISSNPDGST